MPKREPNYHGILIVDKPGRLGNGLEALKADTQISVAADNSPPEVLDPHRNPSNSTVGERLPTSHDIVQMGRRWCQQRRVGHTGTLDPMASGVLVLCLGTATRLVEYYQNHDKQYYAEVCLGYATDTYDALGQITATATVAKLTQNDIEAVLADFRGEIMQAPPLYSAIKQGGESVHRKVRRGESVVLEPRKVTFHQIELLDFTPPARIHLRIVCSAGTYIRSLAHDLGAALQTHGYLDVLRREVSGSFTEQQAHTPETISQAVENDTLPNLILSSGFGLAMPTLCLSAEEIQRFGYGQRVLLNSHGTDVRQHGSLAAATDEQGTFVGIIRQLPPEDSEQGQTSTNPISSKSDLPPEVQLESLKEIHQATDNRLTMWKTEKWFANS